MGISLTNENKSKVSLSLGESKSGIGLSKEAKISIMTYDEATETWNDIDGTWNNPGVALSLESK